MWHCLSPTFLNAGTTNETFQQSGKEDSFKHILRVQQVYMKDQAHSSLEPQLEYNQDQMPRMNHGVCYGLFNHLLSYRNIMQFQITSRGKTGKRDTQVIKIRVLRNFFSKQFCFIRCRRQHLWSIEQRRYYSRFIFFESTISNSPKVPRAKFFWK